jgi:hypothetical protein
MLFFAPLNLPAPSDQKAEIRGSPVVYAPTAVTSESLAARQLCAGGSGLPLRTASRRMTLLLPHKLHTSGREFETIRQARQ